MTTAEEAHQQPDAGPRSISDELAAMVPALHAEVEAADPDTAKLQEARRQLDPVRRALEAARAATPSVVGQYVAGFERDVALLRDLAHERRPGLQALIEHALQGAQGALSACTAIGGQHQRALDRLRTLSEADVHHTTPAVLVAGLRSQFQGLASFPQGVAAMRRQLDEKLRVIRDRLAGSSAAPATAALETLPPRPPSRQERAKTGTGPRDQEGMIHG
jgi:hypothetical protein